MLTKLQGWIRVSSVIIWISIHLPPLGSNHLGAHLRIILTLSKTRWWGLSRLGLLKRCSTLNGWPILCLWRRKVESGRMCELYRSEQGRPKRSFPCASDRPASGCHCTSSSYELFGNFSRLPPIPLALDDQERTVFLTPIRNYHYKVMSFGLKNARATY